MPFVPSSFEKLVELSCGDRFETRRVAMGNLRATLTEHRRILLLGDPDSGKTTTLWRLCYDFALAAQEENRKLLPVLVPLSSKIQLSVPSSS